jgi:arylsulfatase A-like enzyme
LFKYQVAYSSAPKYTLAYSLPWIAGLVAEGIQLDRFYAFKYCSPSRSALQSGRNPIHVNVVNANMGLYNPVSAPAQRQKNLASCAEIRIRIIVSLHYCSMIQSAAWREFPVT